MDVSLSAVMKFCGMEEGGVTGKGGKGGVTEGGMEEEVKGVKKQILSVL